eukprot:9407097-Pyramimonas_sp.AAC.1
MEGKPPLEFEVDKYMPYRGNSAAASTWRWPSQGYRMRYRVGYSTARILSDMVRIFALARTRAIRLDA